jgi:hypothetical protein
MYYIYIVGVFLMYCYCVRKKGKVEEQETPKVAVGKTEAEKRFVPK